MLKHDSMRLIDRNSMMRYYYSMSFIYLNNMWGYLFSFNFDMSLIFLKGMRSDFVMLNRFGRTHIARKMTGFWINDWFSCYVTLYRSFMDMSLMIDHRMMRNR